MTNKKGDNQRNHFRLVYPPSDRPKLRIGRIDHEVIDLSEGGLRFATTQGYKPKPGDMLKGEVVFRDRKTAPIQGRVVRFDAEENQCSLEFIQGIPLAKMMEEQRILLQKYKK